MAGELEFREQFPQRRHLHEHVQLGKFQRQFLELGQLLKLAGRQLCLPISECLGVGGVGVVQ